MRRAAALLRRRAALALLPLSIVPFAAVAPVIADSHRAFQREHHMGPLAPIPMVLTAREAKAFTPPAAPADRVPVLAWHGISDAADRQSTTRRAFARQLALLHHLGYTTIGTAQWAAFRAGHGTLPRRPILLTFDDGRLATYRAADRLLERAGMRAAMFVTTQAVERGEPKDLRWSELQRMVRSGRWDVEPRGHAGAVRLTVSATGAQAPFYAARRYTRSQGQESLSGWEARVGEDLFAVRDRFAAQGLTPHAFAVPFSDYGQERGNDPAIPRLLSGLLTRQFGSFFVEDRADPGFTAPGAGLAERYLMRPGTSLDALYGWLRRHALHRHHRNTR
ncbi:hypothetical protein DSM104299_00321 [Baekduia alba]|uniref:polysaccharide deacetylase family protein n=1 Tax=Baekduia alba TaxID=2997333 RepID=UPI002340DC7F|nr:polysaccharide deacetylase family protein [Baekduia alba]WCB91648.1 hypothetical protein DSM104299_00321 [Baekduia alba]